MTVETAGDRDGLWSRVRAALTRRPGADVPAYGVSAIAERLPRKNRPSQQIDEALRAGWKLGAERHVSLCVLALEMDNAAEYLAAYGREELDDALARLQGAVGAVRPCLRSGRSGFVIVLPDMPVLMARELASKIAVAVRREGVPNRTSHAGQVTLSIGLAAINPQGGLDRTVLTTAQQAVKKAQRRGIGRLEVADLRDKADKRKKAA
ncbi:MAG: diguanylate cyclase [Devosia sp.]|uniref:diguanylate cyclase n=1 Tax=Devosia sp. TaxID=1871048 RepID=UPI0024CB08E7|nr:diguanylate cyclase [Devosia sp.]UYN99688.1 MAG: diguanylate cyclase [Devosia sp.]